MIDWLRWKIAWALRKHPSMCWADTVMWAVMERGLAELLELRGTIGFCGRAGEAPYCGKCKEG